MKSSKNITVPNIATHGKQPRRVKVLHKYMMFAKTIGMLINMISYAFEEVFDHKHWVKAIAVYGSCARGEANPEDLDMFVVVDPRWKRAHDNTSLYETGIRRNIHTLLRVLTQDCYMLLPTKCTPFNFLEIVLEMVKKEDGILNIHIFFLPEDFFYDDKVREEISQAQHDPFFFTNAFSQTLLWDEETGSFQPMKGMARYEIMFSPPTEDDID